MSEALSGTIERVTFHNPENGFAVLRVQVQGKRDPVTVVGSVASAIAGEMLEASGTWERDPEHGPQFKAEELRTATPQSAEGIEKFLGSGLIKGIGPQMAHRIVEVFGEKTLQVIDDSPTFLKEVRGIGAKRIQQIRESWREQRAVRGIMVFLQSHGVGFNRALRIYKTYGDKAIELVQANPYRLATDIWGIGFQMADQLAGRLGVPPTSPLRARAALRYVLQQLAQEGNVGHPHTEVINRTVALTEIGRDVVVDAVAFLIGEKELIRETWEDSSAAPAEPWLYLPALYYAEIGVARALHALQKGPHPLPDIDTDVALGWVEKKMGLTLADSQRAAIRQAARSKVLVITGGPGVGKTTIVRAILEIFSAKNQRCGLTAPTGRAAKRLAETTGREAKTIHRLLEFDPTSGGCRRDRDHSLDFDLLVVDEASMVDVSLMNQLLRAVPAAACVILVGDVDQLPSVGPGTVLADIIASKEVPVVRLTEIFRQAEESGIVRAAHCVLQGRLPESAAADAPGDFYFIDCEQPATIIDRVVTLIRERIPARFKHDSFRDIQVLTPMNRSELGVRNLNQRLQDVLNPFQDEPEVARFGWTFRRGDKVLQTQNNYKKEVFNGDIGRVARIDLEEQELTVDYDGRPVIYDFGELDELSLAYALTIHKSQGSEYPAVVIPLHTQHYMFLQRNLLYTAITRGKKLVVIVGSGKALDLAVRRQDTQRRYTALCQRLREAAEAS
ncbi:MAG: ATP-dependent RecD-like DNA helicase [Planctomycetes bacterium]|nr:ATP-dependent RecD-like DNA helicase [Planctomycetota bacterium]